MELWILKVILLVVLFVISLVFGLLPVWLTRRLRQDNLSWLDSHFRRYRLLCFLNCVAGGVFLGTSLLHLLPDAINGGAKIMTGYKWDIPLGELIVAGGFFLVLLVEHSAMQFQHHDSKDLSPTQQHNANTPIHNEAEPDENSPLISTSSVREKEYSVSDHLTNKGASNLQPECASALENSCHYQKCVREKITDKHGAHMPENYVHMIHNNTCDHHNQKTDRLKTLRSLVLLLALSLHTVFEGLALGLQTSPSETVTLFTAICFHKSIIAFSLGVQFSENLSRQIQVIIFIVIFSLMTPLGTAIGTVVTETETSSSSSVAQTVLEAISAGTFIYITFFEVLHKEIGQGHSVLKVLFVLFGFLMSAVLNIFTNI